ncbi:hypothetical protein JCGZ_05277 [Jatropha curcas]|uniref:Fe2OG dioxygenase domain-containing protein n=1 Tax=Jatropha curcas TaxID=180498 RepID=A0A067JLL2_JATCU|nr:S-norcoclaurine synthase 1 [Jatropha curcas]KDP20394.1 hypothetical protein JCGZ_05277 [Jatropha curcas]
MAEVVAAEKIRWLPVPRVQQLASQQLETVPVMYVMDDIHDIIITVDPNQSLCVPLIDMTKLENPESQAMEVYKLHSACKEWGIFQLINHGVSDESLRNMRKKVKEFFELPLTEKEGWAQKPGSSEGYGQLFVTSEHQKLPWNDMVFLKVIPFESTKFEFWPAKPHQFRETLVSYIEGMREVTVSIMKYMAMGLKIIDEEFYETYKEGTYDMRMNLYPACPEPEKAIGIHPHIDVHGITLLLECADSPQIPGLHVLKDSHWVFVQPIEGALVVDIGGIMEIMSNGIYKAPLHRAVVNKTKERLSIVTVCNPSPSLSIGPAKELTMSGSPALYKSVTIEEYFECFYSSKYGIPFIDRLKI